MEIEQLTLILEAARAAGDGAMLVVFVWFGLKFAGMLSTVGLVATAFWLVYKLVSSAIDNFSFSGRVGLITGDDYDYNSAKERFYTWLKVNWK